MLAPASPAEAVALNSACRVEVEIVVRVHRVLVLLEVKLDPIHAKVIARPRTGERSAQAGEPEVTSVCDLAAAYVQEAGRVRVPLRRLDP
jgi:hypothetical protein